MLDVSTILTWARLANDNSLPKDNRVNDPSAYYQRINEYVSAIQMMISKFTTYMTDIRTFLDRLASTGLTYWTKGAWIDVQTINQLDPEYNLVLANTFQCYLSGANAMKWDDNTQRWRFHTLWNKFTGIASFDKMSGGSFLTCGLRDLTTIKDLPYTDSNYLLPILFAEDLSVGSESCLFTSRTGLRVYVKRNTVQLDKNNVLSRLDPLNEGIVVRCPYVLVPASLEDSSKTVEKAHFISAMTQLLVTICGYGVVAREKDSSSYSQFVHPDNIAYIDLELEDVSNQMITFCRNFSPFRVSTPDGSRSIGFGKGKISNTKRS